ncbi:hypothetical protein Afil01_26710 [Actinorhabdospora filicis]|uniref:Pentapeptide repeat-containing protein n=1 Tax=Actinorhabdospora filicis TaxID=1785913 RepID=A0A9W6SIU6_9ACTN|nr:pentapeptide repeat-containing protein [Actinorhabdospora filicis]GLZ77864.1 hypothetical protein Afil01_26710 [Actinorhabdospora filicis]
MDAAAQGGPLNTADVREHFLRALAHLADAEPGVRAGALHVLDSLAVEHADWRPRVLDVWCAHLRAPEPDEGRALALRLIAGHLRPGSAAYWGPMDVDLRGAHLHGADFADCRFGTADFTGAVFTGITHFERAAFLRTADFTGAAFEFMARFDRAAFGGPAFFGRARFATIAWFPWARFAEAADFAEAAFGTAWFSGAHIAGEAGFRRAVFGGRAVFGTASLGEADFTGAVFTGPAEFPGATFAALTLDARVRLVFAHDLPGAWRAAAPDGQPGRVLVA